MTVRTPLLALVALLLARELAGQQPGVDSLPATGHQTTSAARIASGTTWQPDAVPVHAPQLSFGRWRIMAHANAALAYAYAKGRKGGVRIGLPNWGMLRGSRSLLGGEVTLTAMGSLETLTMGECGFPRLLAGVSVCSSNAVRDFQHPHPPFMELSVHHERPVAGPLRLELYAGLAGEPTLGPPSYLHRLSAGGDPTEPVSGHDTNPAHASAGVLTAGIGSRSWRVEGSIFNARPADPDRLVPDLGPLEARAARISINPSPAWSLQASLGRIPGAAGHHAGAVGTIHSLIASAMHYRPLGGGGGWATSVILSRMDDGTLPRRSALLESSVSVDPMHTWFGRLELADRIDSRVTIIENPDGSHDHLVDNHRLQVGQIAAGYQLSRPMRWATAGLAVRGAVSFLPPALGSIYQTRRPASFSVHASVRPGGSAGGHHHH